MFPVLAIEGVSHASYMDSTLVPSFVTKNDLNAEISEDQAHKEIAAGYVDLFKSVASTSKNTGTILKPLIDGMLLENSYNMKDPCYAHDLVSPTDDPTCLPGSPWAE